MASHCPSLPFLDLPPPRADTTIRSTLNVLGDTETKDVYAENVTLTGKKTRDLP